ncbi:MAG: hypothetical protein OXE98_09415 [Hyphomicrobiales bacterium]|nr:hypothetical protein [Hyphomicrobiales bacterium]
MSVQTTAGSQPATSLNIGCVQARSNNFNKSLPHSLDAVAFSNLP